MKINQIPGLAGCLAFAWLFNGCNVFEAMGSKHTSELTYQGLLLHGNSALEAGNIAMDAYSKDTADGYRLKARGEDLIKKGNLGGLGTADTLAASAFLASAKANRDRASNSFLEAEDYYLRAMAKNPAGSEAYLFHGQAIVRRYGIDYGRVNDQFNISIGIPFLNQNSTVKGIDSIYHPICVAVQDLEHILRLSHDSLTLSAEIKLPPDGDTASDGKISQSVARLDLGILNAVKALLAPIDMDGNGRINDSCGAGMLDSAAKCQKGDSTEKLRMKNIASATANFKMDDVNTKDVTSKDISDNPDDINKYIDAMKPPIAGSSYNLDTVYSSLLSNNEDSLASTIRKRTNQIHSLNDFIGYLRYNDLADNDFDRQNTASSTIMRWHNFDRQAGNHGIRFSYDSASRPSERDTNYCVGLGVNYGHPGDIGHPIHRYFHPNLYETYASLNAIVQTREKQNLEADTTKNGRINLMKNRCKALVDSFGTLGMPLARRDSIKKTCDTVSTVLKANVTVPPRSEWISGTAGVDEELLDGFDNDYDGITDEDARNLNGYEDDNDGLLGTAMVSSVVQPMQWVDANQNGCVDINRNQTTANKISLANQASGSGMDSAGARRIFCIGTLEHRLYLAKRYTNSLGVNDSLRTYYQAGNEASKECIKQYSRLDAAFLTQFNADPGTDLNIACNYKHIWIPTARPVNSEWTGGVFGVDEEVCSEKTPLDNDGDGWIDEDCGSH